MVDIQELFPLSVNLTDVRMNISYSNGFHMLNEDKIYEPHIHNCYEIYVNVSGDVGFLVNNQVQAVRSGSVVLTAPGDVHLCIFNSSCVHEHFCLWLECSPDSPLISFFHRSEYGSFLLLEGMEFKEFISLLKNLFRAANREQEPDRTAYLLQVLTVLSHSRKGQQTEEVYSLDLPEGMQQILDYMDAHFTEIQNVGDIPENFYISRATMNRWFRKYIRLSPREFLEAKKLSYSKKLLSQGMNITDASMNAGFSDSSYFISVFKKKFGKTPLQYQKMNQDYR